ncbi:paraslipin, partial [Marinifilum sp. JC120]
MVSTAMSVYGKVKGKSGSVKAGKKEGQGEFDFTLE